MKPTSTTTVIYSKENRANKMTIEYKRNQEQRTSLFIMISRENNQSK